MADIYVRSTDGSNADSGATWALAKADLAGAAAIDAAGDNIYLSNSHAESTAASVSFALAATSAAPQRIMCVDDSAAPPTALATTATVTTTGNSSGITIGSGAANHGYVYGISFIAGLGGTAGGGSIIVNANYTFESCTFQLANTGTTPSFQPNQSSSNATVYKNCGIKFGNVSQALIPNGGLRFQGGYLMAGTATPTAFCSPLGGSTGVFDGFDFSNAAAGMHLINGNSQSGVRIVFRNCRLPASWTGSFVTGALTNNSCCEMFNCDSADTHYRYRRATAFGTIQDETTLVRTGGASDGTTPYSLKLVANANAKFPACALETPELVIYNSQVGAPRTATVEILQDSATALKDNEIWLEVQYLGTNGVPLSSFAGDAAAVLAAGAAQDNSAAAWTTTGMANPMAQKLAVTFTPQEEGFLHCVVRLAKASATVYVDPKVSVA